MQITDVVAQLEDIKIILVYLVCYTIVGFGVAAIVWAIGLAVSGLLSTIFKNNF